MKRENRPFLIDFLATGFFTGYSRVAPGTCGTAAIALLWFVVGSFLPPLGGALFAILFLPVAVAIARKAAEGYSSGRDRSSSEEGQGTPEGKIDPQEIVIDEFAGYLVAIAGVSVDWRSSVLAFLLFRLFDITKPPPARALERMPGGWGIVLDDIVAGLYANGALHLIFALSS